jgi:leucyl-tRNA synthetase
MKDYDHKKIESKWQKEWDKKKLYEVKNTAKGKKFYGLIEFPYPSGAGLHVGHIRSNTAMDIISRKRRMEGYNVLYPIGWDAFGLPTENFAIKTGIQPAKVTKQNTDTFRRQLKSLGFSFDWSREINTTDPAYYKWTQWIFLQMYKKGLAYKAKTEINWCPKDKIGLANEEAEGGICDRCGGPTEKRVKEQWMLAITKYADRLDKDLDDVNYLEKIKIQQRNWIGKSVGSEIDFAIKNSEAKIKVFTTRADTLFGVTYVVLAPEHELVNILKPQISNLNEVEKYVKDVKKKTDIERTDEGKEKTGVRLEGIVAINPANNEEVPVYVADYVLPHYGTGAVMAVPMHDERDRDFSNKFNLPIIDRPLVNINEITEKVGGKIVTKFKLRDWVFSRQRYWGEPIPIVNCEKCGYVPLSEKDLPLELPKVKSYAPTDNGESPLANITAWVNTKCPKCKGKAKRETDTMPNWAGSSWYFLRYTDPKNKKEFANKNVLKYWMKNGIDWYNGGMEHTTLHLLYSRFWHKFLYDLKVVPTSEPYMKRTSHGMILAEGGEKMSKSVGNTVNPDEIVKLYGADTLRMYEMFMGPFDQAVSWSTESMIGPRRFLERVWRLGMKNLEIHKLAPEKNQNPRALPSLRGLRHDSDFVSSQALQTTLNKTIKKVTEDIEGMNFNTAVSAMMVLLNEMEKCESVSVKDYKMFLQILAPFTPHIAEDLWMQMGETKSIHISKWPKFDPKKLESETVKIGVQVNGKVRAELVVGKDESEDSVKAKAMQDENVIKWMENKEIKKVIYVKGRLLNIVI